MRLCLIEDHAVVGLGPLVLTRPVFDLQLGATSIRTKIASAFRVRSGPACCSVMVRSQLAGILLENEPQGAVNDRDWLTRGPVLIANGRWVPAPSQEPVALSSGGRPTVLMCDGQPAAAFVGPEDVTGLRPATVEDWFEEMMERGECEDRRGEWIHRPWDLVSLNAAHLEQDFSLATGRGVSNRHLSAMALVGPANRLHIHEDVRIDPYTVLDTTNGPITIESGVWIQPFTRIEGPCSIGRGTQLFRANLRGAVSIGPHCRIGGEVEASIIQGYTNKYHEGFLGHAYVGEWVNLGAITSNSDLRNDYGEVRVPLQGDPVATGQAKVGCFIGDHTRTGMGSMLNTGTSIGVMCNVLPAGLLLPKHVPSFTSVLYGKVANGFSIEQLFATARIVKSRRNKVFSALEEQLFQTLFEQTRLERERAFQRSQERRGSDHWPIAAAGQS